MVKLLNSIYLGAAKPEDYGKAAGVVELLPFDYYLGAAVPSHGKPTINVLLSGVSPLTLLNAIELNYLKLFGGTEQRNLPDGYTQVEYLETDGNSYIDTGVLLNNTDPFDIIFQSSKDSLTTPVMGAISGGTSYISTNNICVTYNITNYINSYSVYCDGAAGSADSCWNGGNNTDKLKHTIKYTGLNTAPTIDGVAMTQITPTTLTASNATVTTWLFGRKNTGSGSIAQDGVRIFDTNFYAKGHFIPAKRNSDNVLGMYDTVSGTFFTNAGTGTFTAGPDVVPTPATPVDIVCNNGAIKVKDDELPVGYKRLLDVYFDGNSYFETGEKLYGSDVVTLTLQADSSVGQNVFGAYSGSGSSAVNFSLYVYATNGSRSYYRYNQTLLRPTLGTGKRTISFGNGSTSGFYDNVTYDVEEFETTDTAQIGALPNSSSPKFTGYFYGNITIGNRLKYIPCERVSDSAIGYYETVNGEFLENQGTGTLTTSGYDTSHLTEIYYDGTAETVSIGEGFDSADGQGTFVSPGSSATTRIYKAFGQLPNGKYKVAITGNFEFIFQYKDTDALVPTDYGNIDTWATSGVYDLDKTGYYYGVAIRYPNNGVIRPSDFNGIISLIPLDNPATCQPLLSVGDYKDVQNITNGAITRNVGTVVLDGSETYSIVPSLCRETYNVLSTTLTNKMSNKAENKPIICSHFQSTNNNQSQINAIGQVAFNSSALYSKTCYFSVPTTVTNNTEMQAYMAELAPVLIVYPLATPTTETVTGQTLTITQGTNVVTAEGSVDDLELEISYKGYAELTVEEIEAVNTDESVDVTIS